MLDLFMGDPVYDEQKNVIRRDFGVKNIVAIMVVGFIGHSLMGEMKPISGKRKMRGGGTESTKPPPVPVFGPILVGGLFLGTIFYSLVYLFSKETVEGWGYYVVCVALGVGVMGMGAGSAEAAAAAGAGPGL